jgi:ubiquinone/menaquinone biosynthesis C-methylase UbiE
MKIKRQVQEKIRQLRRGEPVLAYNEFDADNEYWDNYQGNCTHLIAEEDKHHLFLEHLSPLTNQMKHYVVLDLGCGVGRLNLWYDIKEYHGLDTSPKMIEKAKELNKEKTNAGFHLGDGSTLTQFPDGFFHMVVANTVFLHLRVQTVESYMEEIYRVLHPDGAFVLNLPTKTNLDLKTLFRPFDVQIFENILKNDIGYVLLKRGGIIGYKSTAI